MVHGLFIEVNIENSIFPGDVNVDNTPVRSQHISLQKNRST
jgi:hypothetical protein